MAALTYVRLIGLTAGTLLQLFFLVVILGYRRRRNFERVLFFLCLALFFFYSGSLLALNAQIYYLRTPPALRAFAVTLLGAGLSFLPPLLLHLHLEFAEARELLRQRVWKRPLLLAFYAPGAYFALWVYPSLLSVPAFDFLVPGNFFGRVYGVWLAAAMLTCSVFEVRFERAAPERPQRGFHALLAGFFATGAILVGYLHVFHGPTDASLAAWLSTALALFALVPFAVLVYLVLRFNFLEIGRQSNLVYAVSATFLALLYLSLVRRVSVWLEPVLPPEASAAILLFLLVVFFEPLQRGVAGMLRERLLREVDRLQRISGEIQQEARQGDLNGLLHFVAERVRAEFGLAEARLELAERGSLPHERQAPAPGKSERAARSFSARDFPIQQGETIIGVLHAEPHGASLSGETRAALEFLCEQLPGSLDLCRLIEEKLQLERELAERERLAALGQMAASISHNLKNPLGSMKTILQVQLENPELPAAVQQEIRLVLDEIDRLSAKLNQLLRFSRPGVRSGGDAAGCNAREVTEAVAGVFRHEAERRGVQFETALPEVSLRVAATGEAVNEILSNLVVNALEATGRGGCVALRATVNGAAVEFAIEDNGVGIPPGARERILQPFFTTKAHGTGLGLAIVARRVSEFGGRLEWESPAIGGRGTRFRVWLPVREENHEMERQGSREKR